MKQPCFPLLAVVALLAILPEPAAAQTVAVTVNKTLIARKQQRRPESQRPNWVNRADCLADDELTFQTTVLGAVLSSSKVLEVWAGSSSADCTLDDARSVASNTCWLVYRRTPASLTWQVTIRAQNLVAQNYPSTYGALGSGGTTGSGSSGVGVVEADASSCDSHASFDSGLSLHFMLVEGSQVVGTADVWKTTGVDVDPPEPPTEVKAKSRDSRLLVTWNGWSPGDLLEWRFYCDPTPGAPRDPTEGDSRGSCLGVPSVLVPGEVPPEGTRCGTVPGQIARDGRVEGLENGVTYAVGVAGFDRAGNLGQLSDVQCEIPEMDSSDQAGGGFCSVSRGKELTPAGGLGALSLASLGLLGRRKRNDRRQFGGVRSRRKSVLDTGPT